MFNTMYNISSDVYKSNLSKGLSALQHQQEFVDVTLVAEGHIVKAHQNVLALASPYLKEILKTVPCQHPVILFNNIDHRALSYILEYIYTGEVQIPSNSINIFIKAAKKMHITGIQNLTVPHISEPIPQTNLSEANSRQKHDTENGLAQSDDYVNDTTAIKTGNFPTHHDNKGPPELYRNILESDINTDSINSPYNNADCEMLDIKEILNKNENFAPIFKIKAHNNASDIKVTQDIMEAENTNIQSELLNTNNINKQNEKIVDDPLKETTMNVIEIHDIIDPAVELFYCKSIRGNLQMICNRFIYNMHYQSDRGHKRRWRCIEYRKMQCLAYVDTLDENIISRKYEHNHPFHDKKIISLGKKKRIFTNC